MDLDFSKNATPTTSIPNQSPTPNNETEQAIIQLPDTNIKRESKTINVTQSHSSSSVKSPWLRREFWGVALSLISAFASSVGGLVTKYMQDFSIFSLATYRFQGMVLPVLCVCIFDKIVNGKQLLLAFSPITKRENRNRFLFMIVGAVFGCVDVFVYFQSIQLMPLGDVKVILSCRPILVALVAHIFLGEPCGVFQAVASVLAILGVGVICRPPMLTGGSSLSSDEFMGVGFAATSMLGLSICSVIFRYLRKVNVSVITLVGGCLGTIVSISCSAGVGHFDIPATITEGALVVTLGLTTFLSQTALALAMKYEPAAAVVTVTTCDIIFTFLLQYWILGHTPDGFRVIGASLIAACVFLIGFQTWVISLPESHPTKKIFWFILG